MKFVDAHIHLSDRRYSTEVDEVISEAKKSDVVAIVSNSTGYKTSMENLKLAERYPGVVYIALGIHPETVEDMTEVEHRQVRRLIVQQKRNEAVVAIGEIGLDPKYTENLDKQRMVFKDMLNLAEKNDLPAIIHSRDATKEVVDILSSFNLERVLLHWFSGQDKMLNKVIERGYYITEGVPVTYAKNIREIIGQMPLTNVLTETDGPVRFYKHPYRGKRATPEFVPSIVRSIAEIKNLEYKAVAMQVIDNFETFFRVKLN